MGFEKNHYKQLRRLAELASEVKQEDQQRKVLRRLVLDAVLIGLGVMCLGVVIALVLTTSTAAYPIGLGAVAGWMMAGGTATLLPSPSTV